MGVVTGTNAPGAFGSGLRSPAWTALVSIFIASLPFPACPLLGVFENYATVEQLLPDLIGAGEIAILLSLRSLCDQRLYLSVGNGLFAAGGPQHIENPVELIQQLESGRYVSSAKLARVHGRVGIPHVLEQ